MYKIIATALAIVGVTMVLSVALGDETGPGCPGDPTWLGYCSEVDSQ